MTRIITLTKLNGTGYIFDVDDYMWLRQKYRIIGSLIGTRGMQRWAFNEKTLPIEFSKWETQLLLDLKIGVLLSKQESILSLPYNEKFHYQKNLSKRLQDQSVKLKKEKLQKTERHVAQSKINVAETLKKIEENFKFDINNALLEIPMSYTEFHTGKSVNFSTHDLFKYNVFHDCWLRGKVLTSGETFGTDFLVYSGDPMIYHASHMLIIANRKSNPLHLIGKIRTSVIVNKMSVFAFKDEKQESKIKYQTLVWEGSKNNENTDQNLNSSV